MDLSLEDLDAAARTIWGEARGEEHSGRFAVAWVIVNRWHRGRWKGKTLAQTCRARWQFSCWNENDPNSEKCEQVSYEDPILLDCLRQIVIAVQSRDEFAKDPTRGATHYHTRQIAPPKWADRSKITATIGDHIFYAGID